MVAESDPLSCPWPSCNSSTLKVCNEFDGTAQVVCLQCDAKGPKAHSSCQAIYLWNDRIVVDDED